MVKISIMKNLPQKINDILDLNELSTETTDKALRELVDHYVNSVPDMIFGSHPGREDLSSHPTLRKVVKEKITFRSEYDTLGYHGFLSKHWSLFSDGPYGPQNNKRLEEEIEILDKTLQKLYR